MCVCGECVCTCVCTEEEEEAVGEGKVGLRDGKCAHVLYTCVCDHHLFIPGRH